MVASAAAARSGTPALLVILTTLSSTFAHDVAPRCGAFAQAPLRWRLLIAYLVADNAYGLRSRVLRPPDDPAKLEFFLGTGVPVCGSPGSFAVLAGHPDRPAARAGHRGGWIRRARSLHRHVGGLPARPARWPRPSPPASR